MASRRSHAPTDNQQIEYELWVRAILPPHIVPRRVGCSKSAIFFCTIFDPINVITH